MNLKTLHLIFKTDRTIEEIPTQLRGFIGNRFQKYLELHHHGNNSQLTHEYPKVQYNIRKDKAIILGIGAKALEVLKKVAMNIQELVLGVNTYKIVEITTHYHDSEFECLNNGTTRSYKFLSPWLALNQENYVKYQNSVIADRRVLLKKILIGNILSMSKHLGYDVTNTINVDIEISAKKVHYKYVPLIGFKGIFEANFLIPDYFGIGKGVSHGFGTVKHVSNHIISKKMLNSKRRGGLETKD